MPETVAELGVNLILQTGKFFGVLDSTLGRAGQRLTTWGTKLSLAITTPLLGLGTAIAKIGMDYETAFTGVLKSVEEATDSFGNLTDVGAELHQTFRDLALEIPKTAVELAEIGAVAGQLGIEGADAIRQFTEIVAKLSVTTDLTREHAAYMLAQLMATMGTAQTDIDELASTLVYLGNNVAATESEILYLALRMAGAAAITDVSEQALLGMAAAMRQVGIRAEMGGTAMSRVLIDMSQSIAEGGDSLELFAKVAGVSVGEFAQLFEQDAAVAVLAFVQGLNAVDKAGGNVFAILDELELGEIRVRETLLKLAASHEDFAKALGLAAAGWEENIALQREFSLYAKTTRAQLTMIWSALKDIAISIFQAFKPALESALAAILEFLQGVAMLARENPELLRTIVLIGAAIAAIGPAIILIGIALKVLAFATAAILSPLGLLIAGFIALAAVVYKFIVARYEIESFADAVVVASGLIARALNWIADRLSGLIDFIAQAAEWGASAMAEFAQGIIGAANLVIRAISYIAGIIAELLGPGSPPAILPDLADWGREAINEFLYGMTEADFDILNKVGDIIGRHLKSIGFEDEGELADAITRAQLALARVVFEARTAGEASSAAWQELRDAIHDSTGDIERYIRLRMELTQAEEELAAIEQHRTEVMDQLDEERFRMQMRHKEQLRAADKKVQAAEEALQKFREQTAEIPERFTRGRERQLQAELRAAQKERDSVKERHDIEMTQFEVRRHQIQETLDAQVEAAQEVRDLLQKQVRWLEELIGTRLDLFESYDAEKSDLEDLSAIFDDMKRNVEDIFPSMEGLAGKFDKAKEAAEGLFSIWKAFWLGITGAPIDELDVLTYDTVRMWEAGKKLRDAWDKFIGVLDKVKIALQPILDLIERIFGGEELELGIGEPLTLEGIIDGIIKWLREAWPKIKKELGKWSEEFWDWVFDVIIKLDQKLDLILDELETWVEDSKTRAKFQTLGEKLAILGEEVAIFLLDAIVFLLKHSNTIAKVLAALTYLFMEASARLLGVIGRIALDIAAGFIAKVAEHLGERWEQIKTIVGLKLIDLGNDILVWIQSLPTLLATALANFVASVVQAFLDLYNELVGESIIPDLINGIVGWFGKLPQLLWEKVNEAAGRVVTRFKELKDKLITEVIPNLIKDVVDKFSKMPGKILEAMEQGLIDLYNRFVTFKADILRVLGELAIEGALSILGFVNPIVDALQWAYDEAVGESIIPDMVRDINASLEGLSPILGGLTGLTPTAAPAAMGGMMTGLQLNITNYWDASLGSKDKAELEAMMQRTTYRALDEMYGGAA